jgi:hypothetical protein
MFGLGEHVPMTQGLTGDAIYAVLPQTDALGSRGTFRKAVKDLLRQTAGGHPSDRHARGADVRQSADRLLLCDWRAWGMLVPPP